MQCNILQNNLICVTIWILFALAVALEVCPLEESPYPPPQDPAEISLQQAAMGVRG